MSDLRLDVGCGRSKKGGFVGIDVLPFDNVDIVHDLGRYPYPLEDNSVKEIWMDQVLEHLSDPVRVLEELHRICRNDAVITIGVPYFRSFYAAMDPTHRNFFGVFWFDYFDPTKILSEKYAYSHARFRIEKIEFDREWKEKKALRGLHWLMVWFAERKPYYYEEHWSHLYPLNSLTYHLRVVK